MQGSCSKASVVLCSRCYNRRLRAREAASGAAASVRLQLAAQMVPKPVVHQTASMEGQPRECPVCLLPLAMRPLLKAALPMIWHDLMSAENLKMKRAGTACM